MTDVREVLAVLGIHIVSEHKGGRELKALCPHHYAEYDDKGHLLSTRQDHTPGWYINAETGKHRCWSCGFKGGLESLVRIMGGDVDLTELQRDAAFSRYRARDPWAGETPVEIVPMSEARIQMYIEPPDWALEARRITADAAHAYGVRWDDKRDRWILPIRHPETHKAMGFQAKGERDRFFRNLPADVLKSITYFGIDVEFTDTSTVIIVESPLDAVLLWSLGYTAISCYGANVSDEQMALIIARFDRIILALDNDKAGRAETMRLLGRRPNGKPTKFEQDYSKRIPIRVFDYGSLDEKDPGEMEDEDIRDGVSWSVSPLRLVTA